jgi:hypothetical protein
VSTQRLFPIRPRAVARAARPLTSLVVALGLVPAGCAHERPRTDPTRGPSQETAGEVPPTTELRRLFGLSEAVFVGQVDTIDEGDGGTTYRVRPVEVLKAPADAMSATSTHPVDPAGALLIAEFLFRGENQPPTAIGHLAELSRYIFFVSRKERPGEWLNLADAAALRLPEAQPTLEDLRQRKRAEDERQAALNAGKPPAPPPGMHTPSGPDTPPEGDAPPVTTPPPPSNRPR